jgi:hypothetical protein
MVNASLNVVVEVRLKWNVFKNWTDNVPLGEYRYIKD